MYPTAEKAVKALLWAAEEAAACAEDARRNREKEELARGLARAFRAQLRELETETTSFPGALQTERERIRAALAKAEAVASRCQKRVTLYHSAHEELLALIPQILFELKRFGIEPKPKVAA